MCTSYIFLFINIINQSKRIVIFDTLIKQVELPELLAIVGHEIGHWQLSHTLQGFFISQVPYISICVCVYVHVYACPFTILPFVSHASMCSRTSSVCSWSSRSFKTPRVFSSPSASLAPRSTPCRYSSVLRFSRSPFGVQLIKRCNLF